MTEALRVLVVGDGISPDGSTRDESAARLVTNDDSVTVVSASPSELPTKLEERSFDCVINTGTTEREIDRILQEVELSVPIIDVNTDIDDEHLPSTDVTTPSTDDTTTQSQNDANATDETRVERLRTQRRQVTRLHDVGVELSGAETKGEVYERVVAAAEDILNLDVCLVDSVEDGYLRTKATSSELEAYQEPPVDSEEAGLAGKAFRKRESYLVRDAREHPDAHPAGEYRSGITVPIDDHGVFQAGATEVGAFDELDLELVEILISHAREALTRIDHEQQLREQRDRLRRENERLDEFTSIVSHDLRNPLNVVQLRLELLRDVLPAEDREQHEQVETNVDVIESSVQRMDTLITDLLTLAREGETVSDFEPVELSTVVEKAWSTVQPPDSTLEVDADVTVCADASRLQQLLENLIRNARAHASEDGPVTVTVGELSDGFFLADDGSGIPDTVRDSLFDPGVTTEPQGTGLGLAIVSRIAEAHGWAVSVTESENGGARFEFRGVDVE